MVIVTVPDRTLMARAKDRRIDPVTGQIYHLQYVRRPTTTQRWRPDWSSGASTTTSAFRVRLDTFWPSSKGPPVLPAQPHRACRRPALRAGGAPQRTRGNLRQSAPSHERRRCCLGRFLVGPDAPHQRRRRRRRRRRSDVRRLPGQGRHLPLRALRPPVRLRGLPHERQADLGQVPDLPRAHRLFAARLRRGPRSQRGDRRHQRHQHREAPAPVPVAVVVDGL